MESIVNKAKKNTPKLEKVSLKTVNKMFAFVKVVVFGKLDDIDYSKDLRTQETEVSIIGLVTFKVAPAVMVENDYIYGHITKKEYTLLSKFFMLDKATGKNMIKVYYKLRNKE